jgi:hypothetical protein
MWEPRRLTTLWASTACYRDSFTVFLITTDYRLEDCGLILNKDRRIFFSPERLDRLWGPPNLLSNGYWVSFLGGKAPGHEADHSPSFSTEVKDTVAIPPFPIRLYGIVLN